MSSNDEWKLRDWLAGQALAGMLANQDRLKIIVNHEDTQAEALGDGEVR